MSTEDRLARLRQARLRSLVRDAWAVDLPEPSAEARTGTYPSTVVDGRAVVAVEVLRRARMAAPLLVARDPVVERLDVIVGEDPDELAGHLSRQLGLFDLAGEVHVGGAAGLVAVPPAARPPHPAPPAGVETLVAVLEAAGLEVVSEGGVVRGELRGLEVARIEAEGPTPRLEIGVGAFDRSISAMLHAGVPTADALARAVAEVARHRRAGAPPHPVRDLRPERWARADLLEAPGRVGAASLRPVGSVMGSDRLRDLDVAVAVGRDDHGHPLVVAVVGATDVDGPARAADSARWHDPDARLVIAPVGPLIEPLRRLTSRLVARPEVVELAAPWA